MKHVTGACNGCGRCCQVFAWPIPHAMAWLHLAGTVVLPRLVTMPETTRYYLSAHGIALEDRCLRVKVDEQDAEPVKVGHYNGHLVAYVRSRCAQLTDDNQCRIHDTPEFPEVCRRYPTVGDDLTCVKPECGYEIVEE